MVFCHKKQGVLSKSPCFEIFIPGNVVFDTMCKWFTNMDIIDKAALVRGYKNCNYITGHKNICDITKKNGSR